MELFSTSLINDPNLQAYYRFNNGARDTDTTANNRSLSETGTVTSIAAGKYGYGADCGTNNSNSLTRVTPTTTDLMGLGNGPFSLVGWFQRASEITSGTEGLLSWTRWDNTPSNLVSVTQLGYVYNGGTPQLIINRDASGGVVTNTINKSLGTNWHHLALVLSAGALLSLYIDGIFAVSVASTLTPRSGGNANQFNLNINATYGTGNFKMDDVAAFNRALTQAEISLLAVDPGGDFIFNLL